MERYRRFGGTRSTEKTFPAGIAFTVFESVSGTLVTKADGADATVGGATGEVEGAKCNRGAT